MVQEQKKLDNCLLNSLKKQCSNLEKIKKLNKEIKNLSKAIAAIKTGEAISLVIPGLQTATLSAEKLVQILTIKMRTLELLQEKLKIELLAFRLKNNSCGNFALSNFINTPKLLRKKEFVDEISGSQGEMIWENAHLGAAMIIRSKTLPTETFGQCIEEKEEKLIVSFTYPSIKDRLLLKL
jgi:hypothetical protein